MAFIFVFLPFLGIIFAILAVIFGIIQNKKTKTGCATAGIIIGIIGGIINTIVLFIFVIGLLIGVGSTSTTNQFEDCIDLNKFEITKYPLTILDVEKEYSFQLIYRAENINSYPLSVVNDIIDEYEVKRYLGQSSDSRIFCRKGYLTGERPEWYYCGLFELTKTILNEDGTIKDKENTYVVSVYDSNQNYIKTICSNRPQSLKDYILN